MYNIQKFIIQYLQDFLNDDALLKKYKVVESNLYNNLLEKDQVTVLIQNEYEDVRYSTFSEANINTVGVQISCYAKQRTIEDEEITAMDASMMIADKVSKAFDKMRLREHNKNIQSVRKVNSSSPMPLKEGSRYYVTVVRFELGVLYSY